MTSLIARSMPDWEPASRTLDGRFPEPSETLDEKTKEDVQTPVQERVCSDSSRKSTAVRSKRVSGSMSATT